MKTNSAHPLSQQRSCNLFFIFLLLCVLLDAPKMTAAPDHYRQDQFREIEKVASGQSEEEKRTAKYLAYVILPLVVLLGGYCCLERLTRS